MRRLVCQVLLVFVGTVILPAAHAQQKSQSQPGGYPTKPICVIVVIAPGGGLQGGVT